MDKKLLDALAAKAEQRAKDRKNAKQFEVCRSHAVRECGRHGTRLRKSDL